MNIDWNRVVMNLRGKHKKNEHISRMTGISKHKIQNIVLDRNYHLDWLEANRLLDYHYDICPDMHDNGLLI